MYHLFILKKYIANANIVLQILFFVFDLKLAWLKKILLEQKYIFSKNLTNATFMNLHGKEDQVFIPILYIFFS